MGRRRRFAGCAHAETGKHAWAELLGRARLWLLAFFLFSMPMFFLPGNTEYGYTKAVYTLVFVSGLVLLWAVEGLLRGTWEVQLTSLFPVIPAFLVVALLSLTGGAAARLVIQSATVFLYFGFIYLLVVNTAREDSDVVVLLGALLVGGVGTGLYGLLQYTGTVPGGPGIGLGAMISSMGNRQFLAGFLSYLVLPAGVLLVRLRRPWARAATLVAGGFVLAVMLLTRQVGVRLGLGVASGFVAFALGLWPGRGARWMWWSAAAGAALAALGSVGGWRWFLFGASLLGTCGVVWAWATILRRHKWAWIPTAVLVLLVVVLLIPVTSPVPGVRQLWARQSGAVRAYDWWVGYEMWRDRPVFGVGLSAYKAEFVPYKTTFLDTPRGEQYDFPIAPAAQAHNEYVQVAAELGTAGFLVLLGGLGGIVWLGLRRVATLEDPQRRLELILLGGGLIVTLVHAAVTFPWRLPASSMAFVTSLGVAFSPRYGPVGKWTVTLRGKVLAATTVALAVLGVTVSAFAVRDLLADRFLFQGKQQLALGEVQQARELLERSVEFDFFPRLSLYWLGMVQLETGELQAARGTLQKCFGRYVAEPLYLNLAQLHIQLDEPAQARGLLQELLATHPSPDSESHARYLLALLEGREGRYDQAEELLRQVVALDGGHWRARVFLGDLARARGDEEQARLEYERALEIIKRQLKRLNARLGEPVTVEEYSRMHREAEELEQARQLVERRREQ